MEMIVGDLSQLQNIVTKQIIDTLIVSYEEKIFDIMDNCFKNHMDENFYNKYKGKYPRSFQMKNNTGLMIFPIINGNSVTFGIEFDSSMLHRDMWKTNTYRYTINGEDMREEIMESILNGTFDTEFNKKNPSPRTEDIIEKVMEDEKMMQDIVSDLKSRLIAEGFEVIG